MSLSKYAATGEARIARKLIKAALAAGYCVSVNDGEEWTVKLSTDAKAILDALCTTEADTIVLRHADTKERAGSFWLIYGNDADGSELIADHTDNEDCQRLYDRVYNDNAKEEAQARIGNIWDAQDIQERN